MEQQIGVIIVAGGGGTRMGGSRPKQFMMLGGLPVLAHTINNFAGALPGAEIVVVLPAEHADFWKDFAARFDIAAHTVTTGGDERFHSVKNGLKALKRDPELIAVQDGVLNFVMSSSVANWLGRMLESYDTNTFKLKFSSGNTMMEEPVVSSRNSILDLMI